jgi:hypothetical protein
MVRGWDCSSGWWGQWVLSEINPFGIGVGHKRVGAGKTGETFLVWSIDAQESASPETDSRDGTIG